MRKMKFQPLAFVRSLMRRDRHVFVSMTTSGLDVALYELRFTGWCEVQFGFVPLDTLGGELAHVEAGLLQATAGWHLQPQTNVSWVLPPDIVGVVQNRTAIGDGPELDQIFPFSRDDILVSTALNGHDLGPSILWVHKDWASLLQRISQSIGMRCCELFARAQLFTMLLPLSDNAHGVLIDDIRGESLLHIFKGNREIVRSKSLGIDHNLSLDTAFERELAAIGDNAPHLYCVGTNQQTFQQEKRPFEHKSFSALPTKTPSETLRDFALSTQQGIEIGSTDAGVFKAIILVSSLVVSLVLAVLFLVLWSNSELQNQIAQGRVSVRKDLVVYQDAKALRSEALRFAKVVELKDQFTNQPESFKILANVLGALGPDASIQFFSQDGTDVRIAGGIDAIKNKTTPFENTKNFRDLHDINPRSIKEAPKATFARHLVWSDVSASTLTSSSKAKAP